MHTEFGLQFSGPYLISRNNRFMKLTRILYIGVNSGWELNTKLSARGNSTLIYDRSHVALIAQLGEHCTGIAEVVGSNPAQSLKIFSGLCSSSVTAALALMTVITQLLLWDKLLSSLSRRTEVAKSRDFSSRGWEGICRSAKFRHSSLL